MIPNRVFGQEDSEGIKDVIGLYLNAKEVVINNGYFHEIDWQDQIDFSKINEQRFLMEAAWVILSSGMKESVIRKIFPIISEKFYLWKSASLIASNAKKCKTDAIEVFNHIGKITAIIDIAEYVSQKGFYFVINRIQREGINFIQTFPYLGPATSYHLAKNIGLDEVKPDRHLVRVAKASGFESPRLLCENISSIVGDRISVVDLVIWRFATLNPDYISYFTI